VTYALLVDLDGTLVDTHSANVAAYRLALEESGVDYDMEALEKTIGRLAWRPMLARVAPSDPETHSRVAARKREVYSAYMDSVYVNDALVQLIGALRSRGWKVALVTSASRGSVEALLKAKQLSGFFDVTVTSDDVTEQKPSALPFHEAARQLGVSPKDCVICEDSEVGLAAAAAFGCQIWQIRWSLNG
jgi:HAD superfamily hydrolase (TIGR01509 family)